MDRQIVPAQLECHLAPHSSSEDSQGSPLALPRASASPKPLGKRESPAKDIVPPAHNGLCSGKCSCVPRRDSLDSKDKSYHLTQNCGSQVSSDIGCPPADADQAGKHMNSDHQIYKVGQMTIIINSILCLISTKRSWARVSICDQIMKLFNQDEIMLAQDLVQSLSDVRKMRKSSRDTKSRVYNIVHQMIESCLNNTKFIFVTDTTDIQATTNSPKKSQLVKFFEKKKHQDSQTDEKQEDETNKLDILIKMVTEQGITLDKMCKESSNKSEIPATPKYEDFPFCSPSPLSTSPTVEKREDADSTLSSPPPTAVSKIPFKTPQQPVPGDTTVSKIPFKTPQQPVPGVTTSKEKLNVESNKHIPKEQRSLKGVSTKKKKEKISDDADLEEGPLPSNHSPPSSPPPTPHHPPPPIPSSTIPPPPSTPTTPSPPPIMPQPSTTSQVTIENTYVNINEDKHHVDEDGFTKVINKKRNNSPKPLVGAEKLQPIFLYVTSCHIKTNEDDIEHFFENAFKISSVKARKCAMTHNLYCSFTVTVRGSGITADLFTKSDLFPENVKVFLNKYKNNRV